MEVYYEDKKKLVLGVICFMHDLYIIMIKMDFLYQKFFGHEISHYMHTISNSTIKLLFYLMFSYLQTYVHIKLVHKKTKYIFVFFAYKLNSEINNKTNDFALVLTQNIV